MADIILADGIKAEKKTFSNGGEILKLSINTSYFIPFLQANENEKGWVNLEVCTGRNGNQYVRLNTYKKED